MTNAKNTPERAPKPATQPKAAKKAPATPKAPKPAHDTATLAAKAGDGPAKPKALGKVQQLSEALSKKGGASVSELQERFGWQPHSVRALISTAVKKGMIEKPTSEKVEGRGRVYKLA